MKTPEAPSALAHRTKALWGAGAFADVFMNNALNRLAIPIYNMAFGVDARWIGLAMGLPRLWDAFTDPVMGNLSDNTRTRWGRRRPYILAGALLCGLVFALMWIPPSGFSAQQLGIYLLVMSIAYYTAYTIFSVPWIAMGLELSPDYNERTRVQAYRSFFNQAGGILVGSLWFLSFRMGETQAQGLRNLALLFGALIVVFGLLPSLFVRERAAQPAAATKDKINFFRAFGTTMANRTFLYLAGAVLTIIMGIYLTSPFEAYLQTYYVFGGSQEKAAKLLMHADWFYQGISLAFIPVLSWVATHIGKRNTLLAGIGLSIGSYLLTWWCISPAQPYLFLITKLMAAPGLTCVWMLAGSMLADICDEDELKTGLRREGMYTAVYGWLVKLGFSGVFTLTGFMVSAAGFVTGAESQPDEVVMRMRVMLMWVPTAILLVAAALVWLYSIDEEKADATRRALEARRGETERRSAG